MPPATSTRSLPPPRHRPGASCAAWSSASPTRTPRTATPSPASPPSGATVTTASALDDDRLVTVVGTLPDLQPGRGHRRPRLVAQRPQARLAVPGRRLPHHPPGHPAGHEALPRLRPGQGDRPGQRRPHRRRLRRGDLRRHRRDPGPADRGAGHRPGAGRTDRRHLGRAAPHPRGDGRAAGLRPLHLAGRAHLQALRRRQRPGHHARSPTAWPARSGGSASRPPTRSPRPSASPPMPPSGCRPGSCTRSGRRPTTGTPCSRETELVTAGGRAARRRCRAGGRRGRRRSSATGDAGARRLRDGEDEPG